MGLGPNVYGRVVLSSHLIILCLIIIYFILKKKNQLILKVHA